ncbi:MAG: polysaccharide biosynthesis protein, partial [Actinobacteria bacterium]|nr:polysaccharide biosynthesis protein [Actinomycetota bacterium]
MKRYIQFFLLMAIDAVAIILAQFVALGIRFDWEFPTKYLSFITPLIPYIVPIWLGIYFYFGLYNRLWRYASINELLAVVKAVSVGTVATIILVFARHITGFPRSLIILTWLLNIVFAGGVRFLLRVRRELSSNGNGNGNGKGLKRVLIIGAGDAGSMIATELRRHPELEYYPVGFIDDAKNKQGYRIHALPVLGTRERLKEIVLGRKIEEIIIAMPSAPASIIREIVRECGPLDIKLKMLPGIYELIEGRVSVNQIRDVQIEDLLGREEIKVDLQEIAAYLASETVLVTGAGGSIGSEICRQIAKFNPKQLLLFGHGENSIYEIDLEIRERFPDLTIVPIIGDIQDIRKVDRVFEHYRPSVVFHAAAHKHVPLMEQNPEEAIKNNIFGTKNVAEAADRYQAKRFVLISSDKAVNPTSVMGATKRAAEIVIQMLARRSRTKFVAVRFGNVLGSRGSVIPLFKRQIARGGPVTVTHPEMTRYFMTIPEAVQLVIQAAAMGQGGEIFVLDMGKPVKIVELARDLIQLSGLEPAVDIKIEFVGIRPGEKLYEEVLTAEEGTSATRHERIFVVKSAGPDHAALEDLAKTFMEIALSGKAGNEKIREAVGSFLGDSG